MKIISRMVNHYGEIRYNEKTFFVGLQLSRQKVYLLDCPGGSSHPSCEIYDCARIQNRQSLQDSVLETGKDIGLKGLPVFCLQVLDRLSMSLKKTECEVRFDEPVNSKIGRRLAVHLGNNDITLSSNTEKSIPEIHSRSVIVNNIINYSSKRFNFFIHKTRVFLSRFLKTKRSSL